MMSHIWLPSGLGVPRRALIYFVCGNPGLIGFYADFLGALRSMLDAEGRTRIAFDIFGKNLLGFSDAEHEPFGPRLRPWDLEGQVQGTYADVAARSRGPRLEASGSPPPPGPDGDEADGDEGDGVAKGGRRHAYDFVMLAGHSIGAYIAVEVLHRSWLSARPLGIRHGLLLFPTIASIGLSPSGRRAQALRSVPGLERRAHQVARLALAPLSRGALCWVAERLMGFSPHTADVTAEWLKSRDGVLQALHLGLSELDGVREEAWGDELWEAAAAAAADGQGGGSAAPRFFLLYGRSDHWVADHVRDEFIQRRRRRGGPTSIAIDEDGLPHAFCTTERE